MRQVISYTIVAVNGWSTAFYGAIFIWLRRSSFNAFGVSMIAVGAVILLLTPFLTNETVPYYLIRAKESTALKKFIKLKSERKANAKTCAQFDELKAMVGDELENDHRSNLKSFCIVLRTRLLHVFASSTPLLLFVMNEVCSWHGVKYQSIDNVFFTELTAARVIVGTVVLMAASYLGRHKFIYSATILASALFIQSNLYFSWPSQQFLRSSIRYSLPIAYSLLSFGIDYYQTKQSVDAFPVTTKAWSLSALAIIEHLCHAGLIAIFIRRPDESKILIAAAIILLAIFSLIKVPDTKKLSLRATRNEYCNKKQRRLL